MHDGRLLKNNETISQIMNFYDKGSPEIVILAQVKESESNIKITLKINLLNEITLQAKADEAFKNLIKKGFFKINRELKFNNYDFFLKAIY